MHVMPYTTEKFILKYALRDSFSKLRCSKCLYLYEAVQSSNGWAHT